MSVHASGDRVKGSSSYDGLVPSRRVCGRAEAAESARSPWMARACKFQRQAGKETG